MSVGLLFPAGLLALAALLVPIVIHLSRRTEDRVTRFAALRWLEARRPPRSRIRLTEWLLLALRLLLLAALAVLLAQPFASGWSWSDAPRVLVHPAVPLEAARSAVSGAPEEAQWLWLAPQFPGIDQPPPRGAVATASLLREIDATLPAHVALTVVVPDVVDGLDGERIALGRAVDWRSVAARPATEITAAPAAPVRVAVRHDGGSATGARYIGAVLTAWNVRTHGDYAIDAGALDKPVAEGTTWLVWLGGEPAADVQRWVAAGGTVAFVEATIPTDAVPAWQRDDGTTIAFSQRQGEGRAIRFAMPIEPRTLPELLDASFPERLLDLFRDPAAAPSRAPAESARPTVSQSAPAPLRVPLDGVWAGAIALLFAFERLLATRTARVIGA